VARSIPLENKNNQMNENYNLRKERSINFPNPREKRRGSFPGSCGRCIKTTTGLQ
jgi:hypothetical protein